MQKDTRPSQTCSSEDSSIRSFLLFVDGSSQLGNITESNVETDLPCKGKLQRLKSQLLWTSLSFHNLFY